MHSARLAPGLSEGEARSWALLACAVGYWCNVLRMGSDNSVADTTVFLWAIVNHGAFAVAAWALIAYRALRRPASPGGANVSSIFPALGCATLCLITARLPTALALALLALIWLRPPRSADTAGVAVLLAALAAELFWGSSLLEPLHLLSAHIDAANAARLLKLAGVPVSVDATRVTNLGNGFTIDVWGPCASTCSMASFVLAYVVTTIFGGRLPGWRDTGWIAGMLLASVLLNTLRLAGMAVAPDDYEWLHDGLGSTWYALAALCVAVSFPILAGATLPRTQRPACA
jgi:exosortase/archaeosortase family protein